MLTFLFRLLSKQFHRLLLSEAALAEREVSLANKTLELQSANVHIDAALNNMSQGLCMFDGNGHSFYVMTATFVCITYPPK